MIVAGIDASTTATGICVMQDGELLYRNLIAISPSKEKDAEKRIKTMLMKMCGILDKYDIDDVYMEKAICKGGNVDVTIKLAFSFAPKVFKDHELSPLYVHKDPIVSI